MKHWQAPEWEGDPLPFRQAMARLMCWEAAYDAVAVWDEFHHNARMESLPYKDGEEGVFFDSWHFYASIHLNDFLPDRIEEGLRPEIPLLPVGTWRRYSVPRLVAIAHIRFF